MAVSGRHPCGSAPGAGAGCPCRGGRELSEALISQPRGEEPGDLTPAGASAAIKPGPLAVRCLPSSRGGWSGPSPNLRKDEALGVAL